MNLCYEKSIIVGETPDSGITQVTVNIERRKCLKQTIDHKMVSEYSIISFAGENDRAIGQIVNELEYLYNNGKLFIKKSDLKRIIELWNEWHLNDMNAACIHQTPFSVNEFSYEKFKELAQKETAKCPVGYRYGSDWLLKPVPDEVIKEIIDIFERKSLQRGQQND